jgi:ribosome-associated heat shock protein Hsp15
MSATDLAQASQRIDKWLWFARLVKTRSLAQRLVAGGQVRVNRTRLTKASQTVSAGDVIAMLVHDRVRVVQVVNTGHRRGPASEARELYLDVTASSSGHLARSDDVSA